MVRILDCSKAKLAHRVVEVFEYFQAGRQSATVMDIARRYGRPQSSTSELLASLTELGLLHRDVHSRSFSPTARLALLGWSAQPDYIRNGTLTNFMERLAFSTRHAVALFGSVGPHLQIVHWLPGRGSDSTALGSGATEVLSNSTAGLLILSARDPEQARRMLWRLNAEAAPSAKLDLPELNERVATLREQGHGIGPAGFAADLEVAAVLLPPLGRQPAMALGVLFPEGVAIDRHALLATLTRGAAQCMATPPADLSPPISGPFAVAV